MSHFQESTNDSSLHLELDDYDFHLPQELVAQYPVQGRDESRLMVVDIFQCTLDHVYFSNLGQYLEKGDLVVRNNVEVLHSRVYFTRATGGRVEFVFIERIDDLNWKTICNRTSRLVPGERLVSVVDPSVGMVVISREEENIIVTTDEMFTPELFKRVGNVPLPPYIRRESSELDTERYQTVYASGGEAVAAPTAGLHFTREQVAALEGKGVHFADVTLNVSWGTFQPVRTGDITQHTMHTETFSVPVETANLYNRTRETKEGRVVAVGTTTLRVLESAVAQGKLQAGEGKTSIFIHPPYQVDSVDALLTNFHTPRSTLLMLVSAFAGYDCIMKAYKKAVDETYRFFSYGDVMLLKKF